MDRDLLKALHYNAYVGDYLSVQSLVSKGVNLEGQEPHGRTPLIIAARNSHKEVVELLLDSGADVNRCDKYGLTALHHTSFLGLAEIARCLIGRGAIVNMKDARHGRTPLMLASYESRREVFELLTDSGADIHCCDSCGWTALHHASFGDSVEIARCLVDKGIALDGRSREGSTPLMWAAQKSSSGLVELLIKSGADVHCRDSYGRTALNHASFMSDNQGEVVRLLLQEGVDVNARDSTGSTALHHAAYFGRRGMADLLLKAGSDSNAEDNEGSTPFTIIIDNDADVETVKLCIEKGACVNPADFKKMLENPLLKDFVLQDPKLCSRAVLNRFNNKDLPLLYKRLRPDQIFPRIGVMKIGDESGVALEVKKAVTHQISSKGFCNLCDMVPLVLSILCVRSLEKS